MNLVKISTFVAVVAVVVSCVFNDICSQSSFFLFCSVCLVGQLTRKTHPPFQWDIFEFFLY